MAEQGGEQNQLDLASIEVDELGRVVISDPAVADAVREAKTQAADVSDFKVKLNIGPLCGWTMNRRNC